MCTATSGPPSWAEEVVQEVSDGHESARQPTTTGELTTTPSKDVLHSSHVTA